MKTWKPVAHHLEEICPFTTAKRHTRNMASRLDRSRFRFEKKMEEKKMGSLASISQNKPISQIRIDYR